jgi:hypothetical protein
MKKLRLKHFPEDDQSWIFAQFVKFINVRTIDYPGPLSVVKPSTFAVTGIGQEVVGTSV